MLNPTTLEKQFSILEHECGGTLGVSAHHLETGAQLSLHSDQLFFMCSTYKLPIAIHFLQKVERNELALNDLYMVTEADLRAGPPSTLNRLNYEKDRQFTLLNLLKFMLQQSCNTSTDILLRLINGPASVMGFLREVDIAHMRVDRYILELLAASNGIQHLPSDHRCTLAMYNTLKTQVGPLELLNAKKAFKADIRDSTTPKAMTHLLTKLMQNKLLNPDNTEFLLSIMRRCKRGRLRLAGLLPPGTPVAHKTGSASGYTCDVGIISLPNDRGNIAISAYIKHSTKELAYDERILREVGRIAYDYFLLT